ncbi:MAG: glycoside hydrolase family 18 protein [Lentisphaerae bacterium]|nr:glycoside hydrolase family 18 protein [Lentisphaerota bacterium]
MKPPPVLVPVCVLLLALVCNPAPAMAANKKIVPYFISWGIYDRDYNVTNIPADRITHVNYAFLFPLYDEGTDTGALVSSNRWADLEKPFPDELTDVPFQGNFNQLVKLKREFPHLKTLAAAGGWTWSDHFSDIAASSNARTTFAQSCLALVTNYGFDGVDLDWEYPVEGGEAGLEHRPGDRTNYVLLLKEIRNTFDALGAVNGADYLLTVATSADYNTLTARFAVADICDYVDWINVMTYDYSGPWEAKTGHLAPLYGNPSAPNLDLNVHKTIETYLAHGAPSNRLVLGIPFYARGFQGAWTNDHGLFQTFTNRSDEGSWPGEPGVFDYRDLDEGTSGHRYIHGDGFERYWDDIGGAPYLYNPTSQVFITYEDEESLQLKLDYVQSNGLAGVMYWSIDADTSRFALQKRIHETFYPVTTRTVTWDSDKEVELSWHGLTGQIYTVRFSTNLLSTNWPLCLTFADTGEGSVTQTPGRNARITLVDTNASDRPLGIYNITRTPTNPTP